MLCGVFLFLLAETCVLARGDRQPVVIYAVAVVLWFVAPPIAGLIVSEIPGKESAGELVRFTGFGAVLIQAVAGGPRRPTVAAVPANLCLSLLAVAYVLLLNRRVRARIMAQAADEEQAGRPAAPQASAAESGPTASAPPGHAQ
jgi:hypothetical protein